MTAKKENKTIYAGVVYIRAGGEMYKTTDIDPILKDARIVAEQFKIECECKFGPNNPCDDCQAADRIIAATDKQEPKNDTD